MPEAADQPAPSKPLRTWRPMVLCTAGLLLALGLVWFVAAVVVPLWKVRQCLQGPFVRPPEVVLERLGGPRSAMKHLQLYASLPDNLAPNGDRAVFALGFCGPEAMPALLSALQSQRPEIRRSAAQAIARGTLSEERILAVPSLISMLGSGDGDDRATAINTIMYLGPMAKEAVRSLVTCLEDDQPDRSAAAARALGEIGPEAAASIPVLRKALKDGPPFVRREALIALGRIGPDAKEALPEILSLLASQDAVVKADAVLALAGISRDGKTVLDAYARITGTGGPMPDGFFLFEMSERTRGPGNRFEALAPLMEKLLSDKDDEVRVYASRILRRIPGHESAPEIPFTRPPIAY